MKNGQRVSMQDMTLVRVTAIVSIPVKSKLDDACRLLNQQRGWDYGYSFAQIVARGSNFYLEVTK